MDVERRPRRWVSGAACFALMLAALAANTVAPVGTLSARAVQADAQLVLEPSGAPPTAGTDFRVLMTVESLRPEGGPRGGPPFDFVVTLAFPLGLEFVSVGRAQQSSFACTTTNPTTRCTGSVVGTVDASVNLLLRAARADTYVLRGTVEIVGESHTNPANNEVQLTLVVGQAPAEARCTVPKVVSKTLVAARPAIVRAGCRVGAVKSVNSTHAAKGRVVRQSPAAGARVVRGTPVALSVGRGR